MTPAVKRSPGRTNRGRAARARRGRVTSSGDCPLPYRSPAVTATAISRKVVRLSGRVTVAVAAPAEPVTTDPRKNAVVRNRERRTSLSARPPPPPGFLPLSPAGTCGATLTRLLPRRRPNPRSRYRQQVERVRGPVAGQGEDPFVHRPEGHLAPPAPARRVAGLDADPGALGGPVLRPVGVERHREPLPLRST